MGAFYTHIILRGPARERVAASLEARGRDAYVGPARDGYTVVFDARAEDQGGENERLASGLAAELGCSALAVTVHDDDILRCSLFEPGGQEADRYDSAPGYFSGSARQTPASGGDAAALCRAMGGPGASPEEVERVLRAPWKEGDYRFETARLFALVEALRIPDYAVGVGYNYIYQGDEEELEGELIEVGGDE